MAEQEIIDEQPRKRMRLSSPNATAISPTEGAPASATLHHDELVKEVKAGITEYVSPSNPGFTGVLKQRYTDFLVNEILPSGKVLHLENLSAPKQPITGETRAETSSAGGVKSDSSVSTTSTAHSGLPGEAQPAPEGESAATNAEKTEDATVSDEHVQALESIFGNETTSAILNLHTKVQKNPQKKARDFTAVTSNPITDKEQRTQAHQTIRRVFPDRFESSTEKDDRIIIKPLPPRDRNTKRGQQRDGGRAGQGRGKVLWDDLGGEYLHFTLYKENKDTMEVIGFMASQLKVASKSLQFAGTKDRRGVTVQRVSAKRVHANNMVNIGKILRNAYIGDYQYHPQGLELGDLAGNEFVIALRDCHFQGEENSDIPQRMQLANKVVAKAIEDFENKGFINYFGLQRFGSFAASTDTIGMKLLQDDLAGAVDLILSFNPEALAAAQDPNSAVMVSSDDKARAEALHIWKTTNNANSALQKLPRKFTAESCIIKSLGFKDRKGNTRANDFQGAMQQIPRNLRLMYVHAYQSFIWNTVAGKRGTLFGSKVVEGDLVLVHEHTHKTSTQPVENDTDQAGEVIVRPTGDDKAGTAEDLFERARPLSKAEAESGDYDVFDLVLPLPGFDVEYPRNAIGEFYKEFMGSEDGGGLDPNNMRRKWRDISLSGGYRKVLARPMGGVAFEVRGYARDDEQLAETDMERLRKKEVVDGGGEKEGDVAMEEGEEVDERAKKVAVILKLRLGTSQYATMALRELMKAGGVKMYKPEYGTGR